MCGRYAVPLLERALEEPPPDDELAATLTELGSAAASHERRALLRPRLESLEELAARVRPALLDLGVALRHARKAREAREPLRRALDLAMTSKADGLARGARDELLASGARPRRVALRGVEALRRASGGSPISPPRAARTARSPRSCS